MYTKLCFREYECFVFDFFAIFFLVATDEICVSHCRRRIKLTLFFVLTKSAVPLDHVITDGTADRLELKFFFFTSSEFRSVRIHVQVRLLLYNGMVYPLL